MPARKRTDRPKLTYDDVRRKLKVKKLKEQSNIDAKHPHIRKILKNKKFDLSKVRNQSANIFGAGIVTGSLILGLPQNEYRLPAPNELIEYVKDFQNTKVDLSTKHGIMSKSLNAVLPKKPRPLARNEEKLIESLFSNFFDFGVRATLEGEHLNTTYGYVGLEQHLVRFPGDTILQHTKGKVQRAGMAPGLGAWGYFSRSKADLTPELAEIEKWYAVVQTLYLPDWNTRQPYLKDWYKYRKVLIVNPENGKAVVASVADSGPAAWTGKHFGASPEAMLYLGGDRYTKGDIVVFFVDDPENKVLLGPVEYGSIEPNNL